MGFDSIRQSTLVRYADRAYGLLSGAGGLLQAVLLLLVRLNWGWKFFQTGKGKLANHEQVTEFFLSLGIPFPGLNAWFVGGVECIGGLLLIVGVAARPVAALLASTMVVAYVSVPSDRAKLLSLFSDPDPFVAADPFLFLFASLLVFAFGPGRLSLDALFKRWFAKG
jgi:putative oxidoreductase